MEFFREVEQRFERMDEALENVAKDVKTIREELQGVRGAFASMEAHMIAAAARERQRDAQLADAIRRIEALERKAS